MEILLWLVPPVVVTVVAMLWVSWVGRDRREVAREEAVRRLGAALDKPAPSHPKPAGRPRERSTGVAVRRTPRVRPEPRRRPRTEPASPKREERRAS